LQSLYVVDDLTIDLWQRRIPHATSENFLEAVLGLNSALKGAIDASLDAGVTWDSAGTSRLCSVA
jgi:hypothetical protein